MNPPTHHRTLFQSPTLKENENLISFEWYDFFPIEPNPHYETCMRALSLIKEKNINIALAIGGVSVIDATKFIVAAAYFQGEAPWEIISKGTPIKQAIPFGAILTLPATGSEINNASVITRADTEDKRAFFLLIFILNFRYSIQPQLSHFLLVRSVME